jgi:hypothetical protein
LPIRRGVRHHERPQYRHDPHQPKPRSVAAIAISASACIPSRVESSARQAGCDNLLRRA